MKELGIYGILKGTLYCSAVYGVEETTTKAWIRDLDFENNEFFIKLREYVVIMVYKLGLKNASEILEVPVKVLKMLMKTQRTSYSRDLKKKIIKLYASSTDLPTISSDLGIALETVEDVLKKYNKAMTKFQLQKNDPTEIIVISSEPEKTFFEVD
jgi:hypothetical protein